jgi:hypothetical protein
MTPPKEIWAAVRDFAESFEAWTKTPSMVLDEATIGAAWKIVDHVKSLPAPAAKKRPKKRSKK